jgi:hypothetical protein
MCRAGSSREEKDREMRTGIFFYLYTILLKIFEGHETRINTEFFDIFNF